MGTQRIAPSVSISPDARVGNPAELMPQRLAVYSWQTPFDDLFPIIGEDTVVEAFCTIDSGTYQPTRIGARAYLMKGVHVGHDTVIEDGCVIAPHAAFGGSVWMGSHVRVGMGATFRPFISVGHHSTVGQGAAVVTDIPPYECWGGVPARRLFALCFVCGKRAEDKVPARWVGVEPETPPAPWLERRHAPMLARHNLFRSYCFAHRNHEGGP